MAGPARAQAPVAGRWHLRLSTGAAILRGDLRLVPKGTQLSGTLVLDTSDDPPVPIADGRIARDGSFTFTADVGEPVAFRGGPTGTGLAGTAQPAQGRAWQWTAERIAEGAEFYAALPRFRAAQLRLGRDQDVTLIPAGWVSAAEREPPLAPEAESLATSAGLPAIPAESIRAVTVLAGLGLQRRDEMRSAMIRTLEQLEGRQSGAGRARFQALFHPRGAWLVDLHDAALGAARRAAPVTWEGARPALEAAALVPPDLPPGTALVPLALYRTASLRESDSAAYAQARARLGADGSASARAALLLLDGYVDAAEWHAQAVSFLLGQMPTGTGAAQTSIAGLVREQWGAAAAQVPVIRAYSFGYPEAVPRVGVPPEVMSRVVWPENWAGREWLSRRGAAALLAVLRRLQLTFPPGATLEAGGDWFLTSAATEAASTPTGFLEPRDEILLDPGIPPLYAVATAVHEWQHLLMTRHRLALGQGGMLRAEGGGLRLVPSDPYLAEGFAEWMTGRALAPLQGTLPVLGVGEARKLALLEAEDPADSHVLGLRLLRALAAAVGEDAAFATVLAHGESADLAGRMVSAWQADTMPARAFPVRAGRRLVPETRFTIEDGVGDVTGVWIRATP